MPLYIYRSPSTGETKEILQSMKDKHEYFEDGEEWIRVWTVPQASLDSKFDPFSQKDFLKKTEKAGTIGELWDRSAEWSEKRKDKVGAEDPIRRKELDNYSKERKGKKHELDRVKS
jgi:hypothetical protein